MVRGHLSKGKSSVDKAIQHLPHLDLSIPMRRRSSASENAEVGEDKVEVVVDSAIGSPPASLTELPAQQSAPQFSTISEADALGARESSRACDTSENPSTLATTSSTVEHLARNPAISMADFLGLSEPVGAATVCESTSAPLASPRRRSRRSSLFLLLPKALRPSLSTSHESLQHGRIPDSPPTLELNPMALEELWGCPDYFFKQQMPSSGIDPTCKHHEDRSSMDEIFHLELEETTPDPIELEGTPLLPAYSPPTPHLSRPQLVASSLETHCDAEQIERDTFSDPFHSDGEEEEERDDREGSSEHACENSCMGTDSDSIRSGLSSTGRRV